MLYSNDKKYSSWGKYPKCSPKRILPIAWRNQSIVTEASTDNESYLVFGKGRSYGDSCLNENGILLDSSDLNHIQFFDKDNGILRCEAGVSFDDILSVIVSYGWFLPVTPGTRFITVGGAVANDVHGKNHHQVGSFGNHVISFELKRSNNESLICSQHSNVDFFKATIGGLGLTGLITWVEFKLKRIVNPYISAKQSAFYSIDKFFELESQDTSEYNVAWIDTSSRGKKLGRGIFFTGKHSKNHPVAYTRKKADKPPYNIPLDFPNIALNKLSIKAFNSAYFFVNKKKLEQQLTHYAPFFYPLDNILNWNRMYGKRGFFQHQCVIPMQDGEQVIKEILKLVSQRGMASFLSVLKKFGSIPSVGMMSFPREGYTLALDFPNRGKRTLDFLNELDSLVCSANGAIYPAKDARMSAEMFIQSFPKIEEFDKYRDAGFSSSLWRRLTKL